MNAGDDSDRLWKRPAQMVRLGDDEVHVWRIHLNRQLLHRQSLFPMLSQDEKERAGRYHFQKDRDQFIVARGSLRIILGLYLSRRPELLRFRYSRFGKPDLAEPEFSELCFNLSHSHGLALLAVTRRREVGIDVERVRPQVVDEGIAERFFSPREVATLRALPVEQQPDAFFNCWTRKEAYIKARGEGLSLPLDMFDVSLTTGEPAALLETRFDPEDLYRWRIMDLSAGASFRAALVARRQDWRLRCWQWDEKWIDAYPTCFPGFGQAGLDSQHR